MRCVSRRGASTFACVPPGTARPRRWRWSRPAPRGARRPGAQPRGRSSGRVRHAAAARTASPDGPRDAAGPARIGGRSGTVPADPATPTLAWTAASARRPWPSSSGFGECRTAPRWPARRSGSPPPGRQVTVHTASAARSTPPVGSRGRAVDPCAAASRARSTGPTGPSPGEYPRHAPVGPLTGITRLRSGT